MAITVNTGFFVRMDYSEKVTAAAVEGDPDVVTPEIALRVNGNGVVEGENILFGIEKLIPFDGAMTLADLVAAAQAALAGKVVDTTEAVAAAPLPKTLAVVVGE